MARVRKTLAGYPLTVHGRVARLLKSKKKVERLAVLVGKEKYTRDQIYAYRSTMHNVAGNDMDMLREADRLSLFSFVMEEGFLLVTVCTKEKHDEILSQFEGFMNSLPDINDGKPGKKVEELEWESLEEDELDNLGY